MLHKNEHDIKNVSKKTRFTEHQCNPLQVKTHLLS